MRLILDMKEWSEGVSPAHTSGRKPKCQDPEVPVAWEDKRCWLHSGKQLEASWGWAQATFTSVRNWTGFLRQERASTEF